MADQPSIPKGTRDFSPAEMAKRNYIFSVIKDVFNRYGYLPIETPAMENLSTLMGKYGEEGDKLLFKVLDSGNFLADVPSNLLNDADYSKLAPYITSKGLRYDLTVPFARYVVQHRNEITFPFKRYQIQPVWRADRPQKGRYREFYQCDADVIGSTSLLNEVELIEMIAEVFSVFNLSIKIKINNRKILAGLAEVIGFSDRLTDITVAIDKLDKIGREKVIEELLLKGISDKAVSMLVPVFEITGSNEDKIKYLEKIFINHDTGLKGILEIKEILSYLPAGIKDLIEVDFSLARGLNYYTGAIIEVKSCDVAMGSIGGGGRYDNLTGIFGMDNVSGVGISFGAERIYDILEQLNLFSSALCGSVKLMIVNFGEPAVRYGLKVLEAVRKAGIPAEIYPDATKLKKQLSYADSKKILFTAFAGEDEIRDNRITLKNMVSGEQNLLTVEELIKKLQE